MKKQLYFLISIILMIGSFQAHAQTYRLAGTVYDQDGPLPGVAVIVQGSTVGTMTDDKGHFFHQGSERRQADFPDDGVQ